MENVKIIKKEKDKSTIIFIVTMLIVPIISFLFFYVYINFNSILMAFKVYNPTLKEYEIGFGNFETAINKITNATANTSDNLFAYLGNTFIYFIQDTFINMPLSLVICYFMYKKIALHKVLRVIIYLPIIITPTIVSILYRYIIEPGGPLYALCLQFDLPYPEANTFINNSEYALGTVLFYSIYSGLGARFVLFGGAMNSIDMSVIEAGKLDGVSPFRELVSIIIPCIWPTFATMILISFTGVFTASGPSLLFDPKGEYGTMSISYWIYLKATSGAGAPELASATGLIFTLLGLPIVFIVKKLTKITEGD